MAGVGRLNHAILLEPDVIGCCLPDGTCLDLTEQSCLDLGGVSQNAPAGGVNHARVAPHDAPEGYFKISPTLTRVHGAGQGHVIGRAV